MTDRRGGGAEPPPSDPSTGYGWGRRAHGPPSSRTRPGRHRPGSSRLRSPTARVASCRGVTAPPTMRRLLVVAIGLALAAGVLVVVGGNSAALAWRQQDPVLHGVLSAGDGSATQITCQSFPGYAPSDVHAAPGRPAPLRPAMEPGERFFGAGERFGSSAE